MFKNFNYYFVTLVIFGNPIFKFRGTWASMLTTIFLFILIHIVKIDITAIVFFFLLILVYSFFAIKKILSTFNDKDPQEIVIDEFIGQSIPIILYEIFHFDNSNSLVEILQIYFWFFLLFRLFDGLKPYPIDYVDKNYKNTFGIIFDDILAGFYVVISLILFIIAKNYLIQ